MEFSLRICIGKHKDRVEEDLLPLLNGILSINFTENKKTASMQPQIKAEATQSLLLQILRGVVPTNSIILMENAQW